VWGPHAQRGWPAPGHPRPSRWFFVQPRSPTRSRWDLPHTQPVTHLSPAGPSRTAGTCVAILGRPNPRGRPWCTLPGRDAGLSSQSGGPSPSCEPSASTLAPPFTVHLSKIRPDGYRIGTTGSAVPAIEPLAGRAVNGLPRGSFPGSDRGSDPGYSTRQSGTSESAGIA
jgi:hypothetical protein